MLIRFFRFPVHYSLDDSANPAPGSRSAAATRQLSSPDAGEESPALPWKGAMP